MRGRLSVVTVGCKANFADSASIAAHAHRAGFDVVRGGEPADVLVINSCTVTHRADRDCRALARRLRRENPGAVLVMTGCFAETAPNARESLPEIDHWVGIREPSALPDLLRSLSGETEERDEGIREYTADLLLGHTRTFLKIQDGCDSACSYCIVPRARGAARSLPKREVVERAVRAERDGAGEIVLTGIHAGRYGADRGERDGLADLVRCLLEATSRCRFRLGSIEPMEITPGLAALLSTRDRVCPHLHVPLQSGSDRVLRGMRRPYTAAQYRERLAMLGAEVPGIRLGADVIAGFPGETAGDFEMTLAVVYETPLSYLHVFPYSPRAGTESAGWGDDVDTHEKKRRVAVLREADRKIGMKYLALQQGKTLTVAVESIDPSTGERRGTTENYVEAAFPPPTGAPGDLVSVRILSVRGERLVGVPV